MWDGKPVPAIARAMAGDGIAWLDNLASSRNPRAQTLMPGARIRTMIS